MTDKFDDVAHNGDVMYESTESRYATELVNCEVAGDSTLTVSFTTGAFEDAGYLDGSSAIYMVFGGKRHCLAMQNGTPYDGVEWFYSNVKYVDAGTVKEIKVAKVEGAAPDFTVTLEGEIPGGAKFTAVGRYDSERDLTGKYLGEVELQIRDYHFRPRPVSLGVTWTQLSELVLDTSFGVSAEEMLMDYAAQEIKKTLDFQAVKMASSAQKAKAGDNYVLVDAEAVDGGGIKDSYYHTAQLIGQAINRIGDIQLNAFNRGGVSAIVGGPAAVEYLKLSQVWKDTGRQAPIGGHKCGEYDGELWNAIKKVA